MAGLNQMCMPFTWRRVSALEAGSCKKFSYRFSCFCVNGLRNCKRSDQGANESNQDAFDKHFHGDNEAIGFVVTERRRTPTERQAEKELKEYLVVKTLEASFWTVKNFGYVLLKFFANVFSGLIVVDISYPQETVWGTLFAFLCGYMIIPIMRWISDRL